MKTKKNTSIQSLARCLATMIKEGYTENFVMTKEGFFSEANGRHYNDSETKILSRLNFESNNYKDAGSAIYVIETNDGRKGTWIQMPGSNNKL